MVTAMTFLKSSTAVTTIGLLALVNCANGPAVVAQTDNLDAFAISVLNGLQPISIAESREYCGYIFETEAGNLAATVPVRGREDYCDLPQPGDDVRASYHTHGAFSAIYDNEVPSPDDLKGDFADQIDGYISTPGGRVWRIDYAAQNARQLCDVMCVASDPDNNPEDAGFVPQVLTLDDLAARYE